jgi:ADP-ribose pyrophosphatase YjhB (NUDIX family)
MLRRHEVLIYQDPNFKHARVRLTDDEYARAMQAFPILCADVVFIRTDERMLYLADRIIHPVKGWWWIGGRIYRGETYEDAAIRKIHEDTGLQLSADRLVYVETVRLLSGVRQQAPQDIGADTVTLTYAVEITPEELAVANAGLDPEEYQPNSITGFSVEDMKARGDIRQPVRDIANLIFS